MSCFHSCAIALSTILQATGLSLGSACAADLVLVDAGTYYHLDLKHIEVRGEQMRFANWKVEYEWDHYLSSNEIYRSALVHMAYQCLDRKHAKVSETLYAGPGLQSPVRRTTKDEEGFAWSKAIPNTIEERQLDAVCGA